MSIDKNKHAMIKAAYPARMLKGLNYIKNSFGYSEAEAEDIYQKFWVWVLKREKPVPDLRESDNDGWFYKYIRLLCYNQIRNEGRRKERIGVWLLKATDINYTGKKAVGIDDEMDIAVAYDVLDSIKEEWGETCRKRFDLYYRDGYSIKEIAELLGQAEQTIKNKLNECRSKLKEVLAKLWS